MNEGVRITIEEWAAEHGLALSEDQILELAEGIQTVREMQMPTGYGIDRYESEEKAIIRRLEHQIDMLVRYLKSKGFNIILYDNKIVRPYMVNWGDRSVSQREEFK